MSDLPTDLKQIALFLQRLPGIGEKTARRLAFYFLRMPPADLSEFATHVSDLKNNTKLCTTCLNLTEVDMCFVCEDDARDAQQITVVEDVLDLLSFETGGIYKGVYHVLHGKIDPLNHVGPDDIQIEKLIARVANGSKIEEVVLATNFDMEGEATAMYIRNKLNELKNKEGKDFKVTRLAYGLPIGADLEYAGYMTLKRSLDGRNDF